MINPNKEIGKYDTSLEMFVDEPHKLNLKHLEFERWLVVNNRSEHIVAGPAVTPKSDDLVGIDEHKLPESANQPQMVTEVFDTNISDENKPFNVALEQKAQVVEFYCMRLLTFLDRLNTETMDPLQTKLANRAANSSFQALTKLDQRETAIEIRSGMMKSN